MCQIPALTVRTPDPSPTTFTGVGLLSVVPLPSWPALFQPQHRTAPVVVSAQVWKPPALIAFTPWLRPITSTGVRRSVVVPSPS